MHMHVLVPEPESFLSHSGPVMMYFPYQSVPDVQMLFLIICQYYYRYVALSPTRSHTTPSRTHNYSHIHSLLLCQAGMRPWECSIQQTDSPYQPIFPNKQTDR